MTFIGVAAHDTESEMQAFIGGTGVGIFPNVNDDTGRVWVKYGIGNQPAFVMLAADGSSETFGSLKEEALQGHIDRLFG